ncbi:MAG: 4Fe-4S dicluster domain-containing protein [Promethearchaeota archaeon]
MSQTYDADKETFMGVPRNRIKWSPTILYDKCNFCMECDKFCPHHVFEVNESAEKKLIVKNPNNCVVFCRSCLKACPLDALTFPFKKEVIGYIKNLRNELKSANA